MLRPSADGPDVSVFEDTDRIDPIVQDMVPPRPRLTSTPPCPRPSYSAMAASASAAQANRRASMLDVLCDPLGFLGLGGGIRRRRLVGQLAGVDDQKAYVCHVEAPVRVLHGHAADDTVPMPATRRLLTSPPRFSSNKGNAPCCWPHASTSWRTVRAWHQRDQPHTCSRHNPSVRLQ